MRRGDYKLELSCGSKNISKKKNNGNSDMNKKNKMKKIGNMTKMKGGKYNVQISSSKDKGQKKKNIQKKTVMGKIITNAVNRNSSDDTYKEHSDESVEDESEETSDETSEEGNDETSDETSDGTNDEASDETSNKSSEQSEEEEEEKEKEDERSGFEKVNTDPYLLKDAYYIKRSNLWKNRQRVLLVRCPLKRKNCKSLIDNLKLLLPHNKVEGKWEKKLCKAELNEISTSRNCNNIIFFDVCRKRYCLWICKPQTGPSLYFEILDYIPLHSLLFTGNCLLYSRPLLLFSKAFEKLDHLKLIKEMFIHVFGIPNYHPLSKPFYDHCYHFIYTDNLIFFRHYQIMPVTLADSNNIHKQKLVEIGPRFTLHLIKIFDGCFCGDVIYENKNYRIVTSPKQLRYLEIQKKRNKAANKKMRKEQKRKSFKYNIKSDMDL